MDEKVGQTYTIRALETQNMYPSIISKQKATTIQYKDDTYKYKLTKRDPNYHDMQCLVQLNGKERDQNAIQKQIEEIERLYLQRLENTGHSERLENMHRSLVDKTKKVRNDSVDSNDS